MILNEDVLNDLSSRAKASERLRASMDLRTTPNDSSQRVLNALEPGTIVPIHRHRSTTEVVVMLRGRIKESLYDNDGHLIESFIVEAGGINSGFSLSIGQWHTTECLESGTVFLECKDGAYEPLGEEDIMR